MEKRCRYCKHFDKHEHSETGWGACHRSENTRLVYDTCSNEVKACAEVYDGWHCIFFEPLKLAKPESIKNTTDGLHTIQAMIDRINWMLEHWPEGE